MTSYYVFNGDADGICATHQFYLNNQVDYIPITGVKRDIGLLKQIEHASNSDITIFDISVTKNLPYLISILDQNNKVLWFDHHISHDKPQHRNSEYYIQTDADINTSLIVSKQLNIPLSRWAIVGLFGDNMHRPAISLANSIGLNDSQIEALKKVGKLLNYNAYGETIEDLHFHPAEILTKLKPYDEPFAFLRNETLVDDLYQGYKEDLEQIHKAKWLTPNIVLLPDEKWARRIIGDFAYQLIRDEPEKDFAVLLTMGQNYQVSVRASIKSRVNAGEFCLQFPTGGGREKAAGINVLPCNDLDNFIDRFNTYFT